MKMKYVGIASSIISLLMATSAVADHKYKTKATSPYISNICYGFTKAPNKEASAWHSALQSAVNKYNSAFKNNGTTLGFCYNPSYDSSPWNASFVVLIDVSNFGYTSWEGKADYPQSNGYPGGKIEINTYYNYSPDDKVSILMHEISHTIGIMHTDGFFGTTITGTSGTDPNSIFRDPTGVNILPQFTSKDLTAVRNLYWQ